jgi:sulfatase maturation enzyme AslB (radical SAM superfamily)
MRVLCLGNNTEHTDHLVTQLAHDKHSVNRGLLTALEPHGFFYNLPGYYHTTVVDIDRGQLLNIAVDFDQVIVLDQSRQSYLDPDFFYKTVRVACELEKLLTVVWHNDGMKQSINFFEQLVQTNKSFCIFPFIELLTNNDHTTVCCRSSTPIMPVNQLKDFATDQHYQVIRQRMIDGKLMPEHCRTCYDLEHMGMISARQQETVAWANRLNLNSLEDLQSITKPVYYEVRPSNSCNLQCRMCGPSNSELINQEYFKLKIIDTMANFTYSGFDIVDLNSVKKLYVAGGEPTAMPEFFEFLDRCIQNSSTFEFTVNTNANKFSDKFKTQLSRLPHIQFVVSIDGYRELNHYIRWPSSWDNVIDNVRYICNNHHNVTFNVTVSMYNVAELYNLLGFFDKEFPGKFIHVQLAKGIASPLNFPNSEIVLQDLRQVTGLKCYQNDLMLKSFIDSLIQHFEQASGSVNIQPFIEFNNKLDINRNITVGKFAKKLSQALKIYQSTK